MSQKLDREGTFRANPTQCTLSKSEAGSISFQAMYKIREMYDPETKEWIDFTPYDMEFLGFHRLTKNSGDAMEMGVKQLVDALGWNGDLATLTADEMDTVQIVVGNETYNNKTSPRLKWINPADADPASRGQLKMMDAAEVKALANQFNAKFRALVGKPPAPAATKASPPPIRK